jgi:hypothetical protein
MTRDRWVRSMLRCVAIVALCTGLAAALPCAHAQCCGCGGAGCPVATCSQAECGGTGNCCWDGCSPSYVASCTCGMVCLNADTSDLPCYDLGGVQGTPRNCGAAGSVGCDGLACNPTVCDTYCPSSGRLPCGDGTPPCHNYPVDRCCANVCNGGAPATGSCCADCTSGSGFAQCLRYAPPCWAGLVPQRLCCDASGDFVLGTAHVCGFLEGLAFKPGCR